MREFCYLCRKAAVTCYCKRLRPIESSVEIVILQHPLERRMAIGTARMTHRALARSRLIEGVCFERNPEVAALLADPGRHCVSLYPGPGSVDVASPGVAQSLVPSGKRLTVFVIDGTWWCAKKILRVSPSLRALPMIRFQPERGSEYQVRRQPEAHCLSTLEAVHRLLELLDPQTDASPLLELFRTMVKEQVGFAERRVLREES